MKNPKRKGSAFEREVSRLLSEWFGSKNLVFWRTSTSGASKHLGSFAVGDVTSTSPETKKFIDQTVIECKFYKRMDFFKTLDCFNKWIEKLEAEKKKSNRKFGMLFVKFNRSRLLVGLCKDIQKFLKPKIKEVFKIKSYSFFYFDELKEDVEISSAFK